MILIQVQNAVKEYAGKALFKPVSFEVKTGDRCALIGPNGAGKSTLARMCAGLLQPDSGRIVIGRDTTVGYLSQEVISDESCTLFEEASGVFERNRILIDRIASICERMSASPEDSSLQRELDAAQTELDKLGGYDYEYRIRAILNMFGFSRQDWDRRISTFSGGEKTRAAFAKLLLLNPDLLILDEPTNHLDIVTIEWLEDYLRSYRGAVLFVSHDKAFINNLSDRILELENGNLSVYFGNYDSYALEKQHRYELALKEYSRQQEEMERIRRFITFYMPKPRFASRAHDREKKLARLESVALDKPRETRNRVHMDFRGEVSEDRRLMRLTDVSLGYPDSSRPLVTGLDYEIRGRDHIAVMGANGTGKTTLVKTILGEIEPLAGRVDRLTRLRIGYLQQDFLNIRDPRTIFDYFKDTFPLMGDQEIYDHLGKFAFSYQDDREKTLENLSGGEQMRVIMAKLCLENYDILILDEPTNHLDLMTKSELADALGDYRGTLIAVSHDRDFIDSIADRIIYLHGGRAYCRDGSFSDFLQSDLKAIMVEEEKRVTEPSESSSATPAAPVQEKPKRTSRYTVEKLMEKIAKKESDLAELKALCDSPEYYSDPNKLKDIEEKISALQAEIDEMYQRLDSLV